MQRRGGYHAYAKDEQCFCAAKALSRPCLLWVILDVFGQADRSNRRPQCPNSDCTLKGSVSVPTLP